jgi:hypothetical protein
VGRSVACGVCGVGWCRARSNSNVARACVCIVCSCIDRGDVITGKNTVVLGSSQQTNQS